MKIAILTPALEPYGGVRVILNWARSFAEFGHDVTLFNAGGPMSVPWFHIGEHVKLVQGLPRDLTPFDVAISTNPNTTRFLMNAQARRKLFLWQMVEEMFLPDDRNYQTTCAETITAPFPMITVADWIKYHYREKRIFPIHVVENGIDDEFQYYRGAERRQTTVIVEGWESNNAAKDESGVTQKVIAELKEKHGLYVIGYGQQPARREHHLLDEYYIKPTTNELADLYNRAHFLIKCSRYETRSLAPLEAMACGCIPIVSVIQGHPDLKHLYNCFRCGYDFADLYKAVEQALSYENLGAIKKNGLDTADRLRWKYIIPQQILPLIECL